MGGGADDGYSDGCNKNDRMGICARGSSKFGAVIASSGNDEYEKEARIIIVGGGMLNMGSAAVRMALAELEETMIIHDAQFPGVIVLDSCFDIMKEDEEAAEETFPIHNRPQLCSNPKMLDRESNFKRCGYSTKFKR